MELLEVVIGTGDLDERLVHEKTETGTMGDSVEEIGKARKTVQYM